jgi:TonB-dependent SusC/RagA subfamily outer membrane receptor
LILIVSFMIRLVCSGQDTVKVIMPDTLRLLTGSVYADVGYGIKEELDASASLKQVLTRNKLNPSRQNNINNILAGKVAGLKFYGQSDMALGRAGAVSLRGQSGFSTGQGPVCIVDGTILSDINDINYNEIEKVTVLSGPSSSALLGSKGSNGAVIITTKKTAEESGKTEVEINSGIKISKVSILPAYQNSYAGGNVSDMYRYNYQPGIDPVEWLELDGKYYHDYSDDCSWGPEMNGQEYIPWYSWYPGTKYTGTTARLVPQPDNVRDFYNTGLTISNDVTFSRSAKDFSIRATYENADIKGLIPGTSLKKNDFGVRASLNVTDKIKFESNINFFTRFQEGEIDDTYGNMTTGSFNSWFHRDLDMSILKELRDLQSPNGSYAGWNHNNPATYDPSNPVSFYESNYWLNCYTWFDKTNFAQRNDRLYGNLTVAWAVIKGIDLKLTYRRQQSNGWSEVKVPRTSLISIISSYSYLRGYYSTGSSYSSSDNLEGFASIKKTVSGITFNADLGFDFYSSLFKSNSANTVNGFSVPDLYTISNSRDLPQIGNLRSREKQRALFLKADVGYKDIIFAEFVLRREYHSALPPLINSLTAKSFGGSFVFSRLLSVPYLSYGKLHVSYGEIPNTIGVYAYQGLSYVIGQYQWNGNQLMTTPDYFVSPDIKGSVKKEFESGIDIGMFNDRIYFILTLWKGKETGIPVTDQVSNYSGFTTRMMNSGIIDKSGIDFILNFDPFTSKNIRWHSSFVISKLIKQEVDRIADGTSQIKVQTQWWNGTPAMVIEADHQWGELYGSGMKVSSSGEPFLDHKGFYVTDTKKYFGSVLPKITGGMQNSIQIFNNLSININFDYQVGGKFFSLSDMWGTFSGLTERTAVLNDKGNSVRDPVSEDGGVHIVGVDADMETPVDYYVKAQDYFHSLYNNRIYDSNVYDASYLKLRELSIDYRIPLDKLRLEGIISEAAITLFAQNPWMIYASQRNFDPSELSYISGEQAQFPGVRSFGMNLKVIF